MQTFHDMTIVQPGRLLDAIARQLDWEDCHFRHRLNTKYQPQPSELSMTTRTGPLSDVRILDLTQALAGPYCTMLLADLGADVIKVEPAHGDMTRTLGPSFKDRVGCDYTPYFASVNRNKRSI